jgi:preprotein translocase subunit SecG
MSVLISVLLIIVCVLLVLVVIIQNPKGGGLSAAFSSSNQIMGVRKTADFLEKATWTLAISLVLLSFLSAMIDRPQLGMPADTEIREQVELEGAPVAPGGLIPPQQDELPAE